ncbi:hypothetical protein IW150_005552, partial [Coemansia sp. RSA 2607]
MFIIEASASARSEQDWVEKLEGKDELQWWVYQLESRPEITQEHIDYFVVELRYYAKLQRANITNGTKHSTVDMVWVMDIKDDELLVQDFKHH